MLVTEATVCCILFPFWADMNNEQMNHYNTKHRVYTFTMRTSSLEKRLRVHIIPWITFFSAICMSYLFSTFLTILLLHFAIIIFSPLSFGWKSSKAIMTFFTFARWWTHWKLFHQKLLIDCSIHEWYFRYCFFKSGKVT